jgi:hypothetical protein
MLQLAARHAMRRRSYLHPRRESRRCVGGLSVTMNSDPRFFLFEIEPPWFSDHFMIEFLSKHGLFSGASKPSKPVV